MTPAASPSPESEDPVEAAGRRAKAAAALMAGLPTGIKNDVLTDLAEGILDGAEEILQANEADVQAAADEGRPDYELDLLILTRPRLFDLAQGLRAVAAQPDPVGEVLRGSRRPNGLNVQEVRVPLGVVGVVYENRPYSTVDAISLCLKAGNAVVLHAGALAVRTNEALLAVVNHTLRLRDVPEGAVQLIQSPDPATVERMLHMTRYLDLLIPRGSREFIARVCGSATVPTLATGTGKCHIFVERTARLDMAADITFNAKVNRPGALNSVDTVLIDRPVAESFLEIVAPRMHGAQVELRGCPAARELIPYAGEATETDWTREFLSLVLAVKVVDGLEPALQHIARYGTHLAEAIVTQDYTAARRFTERVDAAAVYVNASTRFTDGYELGLGAELGISTQRLHRRGPIGLRALTTWKWIIHGEGQVRD